MKQSRFSPRRPANGAAYTVGKKPKNPNGIHNTGSFYSEPSRMTGSGELDHPNKVVKAPKYLEEYELGIFIDDVREMSQVDLPKAKEWKVFRCFKELQRWLDNLRDDEGDEIFAPVETAFISFDHYLEHGPWARRFTGSDCLVECKFHQEYIAKHIDIQGHSSDESMNVKKIQDWYNN